MKRSAQNLARKVSLEKMNVRVPVRVPVYVYRAPSGEPSYVRVPLCMRSLVRSLRRAPLRKEPVSCWERSEA